MKSFFLRATLMGAMAIGPFGPWGGLRAAQEAADTPTDAEVAAHAAVLDLAGAFTNDGFKLRDGDHAGMLKPGETALIQVNLYAGNQYWFSVATADPKTTVTIDLYDETGKLVKTDPYANANRAATGFAPDASGPYYVRVANPAETAATYCLIYSYK
jgi:hypothetical protein